LLVNLAHLAIGGRKELLVEEKAKPETKSLKAEEFGQTIGERKRVRNEVGE
jgi:hypothetical protein